MPQTYFTLLTKQGFAAITNAAALKQQITISQMAVGDGAGNATTPDESQTALVHETYRGALNLLTAPNDSQILAELVIPAGTGGFTIRELGLYDDAGHLLAVANFPATYKPSTDEGTTSDLVLRMLVQVGNASAVAITLDPSAVLATRDWVLQNIGAATVLPGGDPGMVLTKLYKADGSYRWRRLTTADIDGLEVALESNKPAVTHDATCVSPADGVSAVVPTPTLVGSAYYPLYGVPQQCRHFRVIKQGGDWNAPDYTGTENAQSGTPATSHAVGRQLDNTQGYLWQYQDENTFGELGAWSDAFTFSTGSIFIEAPTITNPADSAVDVGARPVIQLSDFVVGGGGADTLRATSVRIRNAQGVVVWQVDESTDRLNNFTVPDGVMQDGQAVYTIDAKYYGATYGASAWSAVSTITTAASFLPDFVADIGKPFGGGYVAGKIVSDYDGNTYGLIVSSGSGDSVKAGAQDMTWSTRNGLLNPSPGVPPMTLADGKENYDALKSSYYFSDCTAAQWVENECNSGQGLNGYTDWYLPSRDELELLYRQFTPTTYQAAAGSRPNSTTYYGADGAGFGTNANSLPKGHPYSEAPVDQAADDNFKEGGADAFSADHYWSSTSADGSDAWGQEFEFGHQMVAGEYNDGSNKSNFMAVRAVRRVKL